MTPGGGFDWRRALTNAWRLLRRERDAAESQRPFAVVFEDHRVALRRYGAGQGRPILLVPPLMVTSAIYDIAPHLSAVGYLEAEGADVWLADFGAPEDKVGGLSRTLDDHVLAVSDCIERIVAATGEDVHLIGYSQGGMFCYQAAAYRFGRFGRGIGRPGLASIVAFGAPVDIRRNLPLTVHDTLAERLIASLRRLIDRPLAALDALPGALTAAGFKLLAPLGQLRQLMTILSSLDDEEALARILPKRRFLGGEGFIAWPGPALRKFIDDFIVDNRMKRGGFVIQGRATSLADIEAPILSVLGLSDDLALPEAVRGIVAAAERAEVRVLELRAGHFGLVVGSLAMRESWPTVLAWCRWLDEGALPDQVPPALVAEAGQGEPLARTSDPAERVWNALGEVSVAVVTAWDQTRWRLPRLVKLLRMTPTSRVSLSRLLGRRARAIPDQICFVWRGRAYTYAEAQRRVDIYAAGLYAWGVRPRDEVGVAIADHPDLFSVVLAIARLGAVAVLGGEAPALVSDAPLAHRRMVLVEDLGALANEDLSPGRPDPGLADEPALRVEGRTLTHGEWFTRALEEAYERFIRPGDTVLVAPPFSGARALVQALGGALLGGARLALASEDEALSAQAARAGATHVYVDAPVEGLSGRGLTVVVASAGASSGPT